MHRIVGIWGWQNHAVDSPNSMGGINKERRWDVFGYKEKVEEQTHFSANASLLRKNNVRYLFALQNHRNFRVFVLWGKHLMLKMNG